MNHSREILKALAPAAVIAALWSAPVSAASITLSAQHFANGQLLTGGIAEFLVPQAGAPAPFGQFIGGDTPAIGGVFAGTWSFLFAPGAWTAASITFGIYDIDSAASGQQLAAFSVDGVDLTAALNPLVEASGVGTQAQFDVFTVTLTGAALAALADGVATFFLQLSGPALCGAAGTVAECVPNVGNGAGLDFSTLTFTAGTIPEPATLLLVGAGLLAVAGLRRRRAA